MSDRPTSPSAAPLRLIDLFAGCGGLSEGFRSTGQYEPVAAVEQDLFAAATYAANFGEDHLYHGDIADWIQGEVPAADVVVGGPPCQGFSNLGAKREDDERNELWERYVDTLVKVRPKAFLLENVERFLKTRQFGALRSQFDDGQRLSDYDFAVDVVKATDFGSSQLRKRAILIGTHKDLKKIKIPEAAVADVDWKTVKHALGDLEPVIPPGRVSLPKGREFCFFGKVVPGWYMGRELHITRHYTPLSLERFSEIPPGGNRFNLSERLKAPCWKNHTRGAADVMGRLVWNKPSVTIRTEFFKPEKGRYLHPDQPRALSHLEAARLQGFSDRFKWCGTKLEIARQIGNAVPVELAAALARHIAEHLGA